MGKCPFHQMGRRLGFSGKKTHWMEMSKQEKVVIRLHGDHELKTQMNLIQFQEDDLRLLKVVKPWIEAHLEEVTSAFYDIILDVENLKAIIQRHSTVERLKQTLSTHLLEMFSGNIDAAFIEKRLRIARTHMRIGLEPKWYMGAFQNLYHLLVGVIARHVRSSDEQIMINHVIGKLINLEQQLVLEAYEKENNARREKMYTEIKEDIKSKIAAVSEEATVVVEKNGETVQQLAQSSSQVHRSFEHFMAKIQEARKMTALGKDKLRQLTETVNRIGDTSLEMEKTLEHFIHSYEVIQQMMITVQNIAKRTNLLALNAAIEASRGGAQNGFHVIAKEVRKLSDDTKQSIDKMSELVQRLNERTMDVAASVEEVRTQLEVAQKESVETRSAFEQIDAMMDSNMGDIRRVAEELDSLYGIIRSMNVAAAQVAASLNALHHTTKQL